MNFNLNPGDLYAILTAFCWSVAVVLFQVSTRKMGSNEINLLKNSIGFFGFALVMFFQKMGIPEFSTREIIVLVVSGALGIAGGDLFFLAYLRRIGAGLTAIVSTVYSPAVVIVAFFAFGETISLKGYIGGTLIITGIVVSYFRVPEHKDVKDLGIGIFYGILAQALTAVSVLMVKPVMAVHPIVSVAMIRLGTSVVLTGVFLLIAKGGVNLIKVYKTGMTSLPLVVGAIFGTFLSVILWLAGFKYTLAGRAAIYNQLSTILIILFAAAILRERMTFRKWIAVALALMGALIVSSA